MEHRVNSLETDLELLKKDMSACQASIRQDISYLKETRAELPVWLKNSAVAIIFAIFAQTVTTVWWASELSTKQENIQAQVKKNTSFIDSWPVMHNEVMIGLAEIKSDGRYMKDMLQELKKDNQSIKAQQYEHFSDITKD